VKPAPPLAILNASILTMDPLHPRAEALYCRDGSIVAVGSNTEIRALAEPDTVILNAEGATVTPGFSENHMHLFSGAAELDHLQLAGISGFDALAASAQAYAAGRPDQLFLFAQGADYTLLGTDERMTRHHLDRIFPDRAFAIFSHDHHTAWANTKALDLSGLLNGAEVGAGAEIMMGEDGLATGELREMEAFDPLLATAGADRYRLGLSTGGEPDPYPTGADFETDIAVMRRGLEWCVRHGFTSLLLMDGNYHQLQLLAEIRRRDGFLPARVRVPFHFKNFMALGDMQKGSDMAAAYGDDELSSGTVKMFYDGVLDAWTALMVEPYANKPGSIGDCLFTQEQFTAAAIEADRRGLQIAVHAIGDGAVRAVLNGYEAARAANGRRDSRHRIEHIEVIHPDDIPRFAELGVIASMQPPHPPGAMGLPLEPTVSMIGRERWPYAYAWRTLKDAGAHIPFASDWPVSPICPIRGMKAAITRRKWAETDPDQRFTLTEAIAAYTVEGAYAEFKEDRKGMIRPGYFADITVFSRDLEALAPEALDDAKVQWTITGGRVVHAA